MSEVPKETYEFTKNIPFSEHLGIKVESLEKGVARLSMIVKPEFMTSWGTAHGGSILSLLDITLSMAARTLYESIGFTRFGHFGLFFGEPRA